MARSSNTQLIYQAIRIEGGLIPANELVRLTTLQTPDKTEQTDSHYRIPKGLKLRDEVARYWKIGQSLWTEFQTLRQRKDVDAYQVTVCNFLVPLLRDVLGFTDVIAGATVDASGHTYNIGYAAREGRLPLVLAGHTQLLDAPTERFGEFNPDTGKTRRRSPFMLAQEALNASDQSLWAITSNGLSLRILRDNPSLTRPSYVEVDLEALFSEDLYADFTAFWLLAHASRFGAPDAEPDDCPWERWRAAGQEAGVTIRSNLRYQVTEALRALGTGFLSHPANTHLREQLQRHSEGLGKQAFFEELLGLVYRLIFLSTVEDRMDPTTGRPLIFVPSTTPEVQQRYLSGYSLTWLRERAVRRSSFDSHNDLWQALSITFDALEYGQPLLGLPPLGGLFDADQCPNLASAHIENRWLLAAVFQLGYFRHASSLTRVNYRDMGPEELGSVYESLLELVPDIQNLGQPHAAKLAFVGDDDTDASTKGNTRKLTGSYYTPDSLVQELIKSALEPVITATVKANPERPVDALLQLTVCDPACGSGHFLLAAARRLADEVAKLRSALSAAEPSETTATEPFNEQQAYRHALRDVVSHCIYGVDKNPMAIALAKTALWLETYTPDRPLTFLDHHLRVGDALLGVLEPKILENGIPDEAFSVLSGDEKATATALKKQNKADLKSLKSIAAGDLFTSTDLATQADVVEHLSDGTLADIATKRYAWARASALAQQTVLAKLADTYVAAFLLPKLAATALSIPLSGYLWGLSEGQEGSLNIENATRQICVKNSVFHWWLAFPHVSIKGGFSVMLGNPPWERIKLQEEEFFASRSPLIASIQNKAERVRRIELLRRGLLLHTLSPEIEAEEGLSPPNLAEIRLYDDFISARRGAEAASLFAHDSGRYPLSGIGDVNTYALFAETLFQLVAKNGRVGFIVPTGIATDDSTKVYFGNITQQGRLVSLYDFENSQGVFPAVHRSYKFSLVTLGASLEAKFVCFATQVSHLADDNRRFTITPDEFCLINPNTRTCPVFRSQCDAELTKKIYRTAPILLSDAVEPNQKQKNDWGLRIRRVLNMGDVDIIGSCIERATSGYLPVIEAKMVHQFDHRWATYVPTPNKSSTVGIIGCSSRDKEDETFLATPRYWIREREVLCRLARVPGRVSSAWLAVHKEVEIDTHQHQAHLQKMLFAMATWVAGDLFRQEMLSIAVIDLGVAGRWRATEITEWHLKTRFRALFEVLKSNGVEGKKALPEFSKWAESDRGFELILSELSDISQWSQSATALDEISVLFKLLSQWMDLRSPKWLVVWRDICRSTDERTVIASVIPRSGTDFTLRVNCTFMDATLATVFIGNLNSILFDFIARQKLGGTHLADFVLKQLPMLQPECYTQADFDFISPRVLELTYTADDLKPWAEALGFCGVPFKWNPERRAELRAELDAYFARLYGLTRDELRYILDPAETMGSGYPSETFRVLKNGEMREFGEYRTQRLVLEAWDAQKRGD